MHNNFCFHRYITYLPSTRTLPFVKSQEINNKDKYYNNLKQSKEVIE